MSQKRRSFLRVAFVKYFITATRNATYGAWQVLPSLAFLAPLPTPHFQYLFHVGAVWPECESGGLKAYGKPPLLQLSPGVPAESSVAQLFLLIPFELKPSLWR